MRQAQVGLGFVGAGRWARALAGAAERTGRLRVAGCYDPSAEAAASFQKRFGGRIFTSLEALLEAPEVEGMVVVTPNRLHVPVAEQALRRSKPVFVEKPLADCLSEATRLKAVAQAARVPVAVGHCARRLQGIRRLRALVESGDLGELVLLEANYSNDRALNLPEGHWRADPQQGAGGPWVQLGVHHVDTLHYLAGRIRRVWAVAKQLRTSAPVQDTVGVLAEHCHGPVAYVGCAWVTPGVFWMRVCGTRAIAVYELDLRWWARSHHADVHSYLTVRQAGRGRRIPLERGDMLAEELAEFGQCVRGEAQPEVGVEEGLQALAVLEAARRSAETGHAEEVPEWP